MKDLISESHFANLLPDLLNGIHFWCGRRDKTQMDILWNDKRIRFMPGGSITYQDYFILEKLLGQLCQEYIHTTRIAIRHNPKGGIACYRFHSTIYIPVFSDMMTGNMWPVAFAAPTVFGLIDSAKSRFILKHQPNFTFWLFAICSYLVSQNCYLSFNFFEASIASSLALFGCWLRGIIFRHPCRFRT